MSVFSFFDSIDINFDSNDGLVDAIYDELIAVVKNMFRLPEFLTGEEVVCNSLKLL
jgi:hypothetical protein